MMMLYAFETEEYLHNIKVDSMYDFNMKLKFICHFKKKKTRKTFIYFFVVKWVLV